MPRDRHSRSRTRSRSRSHSRNYNRNSDRDRDNDRGGRGNGYRSNGGGGGGGGGGDDYEEHNEADLCRLHIADLTDKVSKTEIEKSFGKYGEIEEVWMAKNPPCFAFVVFKVKEDADEALKEMDGRTLGGRRIRVTLALPRTRGRKKRWDADTRCYQCGKKGHFSRDCRNEPDNRRRNRYSRSGSRDRRGGGGGGGSYRGGRSRTRSRSYSRSRSGGRGGGNGDRSYKNDRRSRSRSVSHPRRRTASPPRDDYRNGNGQALVD